MRFNGKKKQERRKRELEYGVVMVTLVLRLIMVFAAEYRISWMVVSGVLKHKLSRDFSKNLVEESLVLKDLRATVFG